MIPNHFTNEFENFTADFALLVYAVGQRMDHLYIRTIYNYINKVNETVQSNDMSIATDWVKILRVFEWFQTGLSVQFSNTGRYVGTDKAIVICIRRIIFNIQRAFIIDVETATSITTIADRVVFMLKKLKQLGIYLKQYIVTTSHAGFEFTPFLSDDAIKQAFLSMIDRLLNTGAIIVKLSTPRMSQTDTLWTAVGKLTDLIDK